MMYWIPDLLTALRLLLAGVIVALGITRGRDVVPIVVLLVIIGWTSDNLDGFIARRTPNRQPSWLGRHDFVVDVIFTWATLTFVLLARFLPWWLGVAYTLLALTVALWVRRKPITILFLRVIDVISGVLLLWFYLPLGLLLLGFLLILAVVQWPRLARDSVIWAKTIWSLLRNFFRGQHSVL